MSIEFESLAICECCVMVAANGDSSGHDFMCGPDAPEPLCKESGNVIVASSEEAEPWFSWSSCDTCGGLAGTRYLAYVEIPQSV